MKEKLKCIISLKKACTLVLVGVIELLELTNFTGNFQVHCP